MIILIQNSDRFLCHATTRGDRLPTRGEQQQNNTQRVITFKIALTIIEQATLSPNINPNTALF